MDRPKIEEGNANMPARSIKGTVLASFLLSLILGPQLAEACSRILWHTKLGTYVGRGEDWFRDAQTDLWTLPRGMARIGATTDNPYKWTSKYGSVVVVMDDHVAMSGMNERGFSAHVLWLQDTKVAPRNASLPGISISQWMQWYLDSFETVKEAVDASRNLPFQIRMAMDHHGTKGLFHIAVEDVSGDSAIFEMIDGQMKIYHDRRYIVMTNEPTYDKQLAILSQYAGFGGTKPLPGTHDASDRFIRGAFYAKNLPNPKDERDAVAALMSVMRNVGMPFGMPSPERPAAHAEASPSVSFTIFRMILNLDKRVLYFDRVFSPTVFWIRLEGLDFSKGASVKKLVTAGNDLALDVTDKFQPSAMFVSIPATEKTLGGP
jgi:choloylglycine hydrolase